VSIAGLIAIRPGHPERARLIHRSIPYHGRTSEKKGFTRDGCIRLPDAGHQQLRGPIVLVRDSLNTHQCARMRALVASRDWLTVFQPPAYGPELKRVEAAWSAMKAGPVNLAKRDIDRLQTLIKTRLRRMQHRPP
jgi:hypothetical protein